MPPNPDNLGEANGQPSQFLGDPRYDHRAAKAIAQTTIRLVPYRLKNAEPQTAGNYGNIFTADRGFRFISVVERHRVACSSSGTLTIEKCASGVAPDSGTVLLESTLALNTTANTPQYGVLTKSRDNLLLRRGDTLVAKDAGTLTATEDVVLTIYLLEI